ncbi:MAG: hypothetical protein GW834_15275 [Cyanobacteria bacterium]|nr:hypothetical protein [Cyanobacteria bacterium CG_2015-09_32_10]
MIKSFVNQAKTNNSTPKEIQAALERVSKATVSIKNETHPKISFFKADLEVKYKNNEIGKITTKGSAKTLWLTPSGAKPMKL